MLIAGSQWLVKAHAASMYVAPPFPDLRNRYPDVADILEDDYAVNEMRSELFLGDMTISEVEQMLDAHERAKRVMREKEEIEDERINAELQARARDSSGLSDSESSGDTLPGGSGGRGNDDDDCMVATSPRNGG